MGTPYQRQDTTNNIANGNVINADDLDGEFDAIQAAFAATTGHSHDGTVGEGGPIVFVGQGKELTVSGNKVQPISNNLIDLGTPALKFKDGYIEGTLYADTVILASGANVQDRINNLQPLDPALTSISELASSANKMLYYTASDVLATTDLTVFGRSLLDDASAAAARTTLGLAIGTDVQGFDPSVDSLANLITSGWIAKVGADLFCRTFTPGRGMDITAQAGGADPVFSVIWSYESGNQTISNGSLTTLAHGLSSQPKEVQVFLRCTTAQAPYSVGDEIEPIVSLAGPIYGVTATADATNIELRVGSGGVAALTDTGTVLALTNSSWRIIVRAR